MFLLIMRIKIQWNSLFPLSMPYVTTLQYREIFWQNGSLLYGSDTAKQEFFMRLQLRLQSLHKHDFISNQLLFYFSVSFSFIKVGIVFMVVKALHDCLFSVTDGQNANPLLIMQLLKSRLCTATVLFSFSMDGMLPIWGASLWWIIYLM